MPMNRRRRAALFALGAIGSLLAAVFVHATRIEPDWLRVREYSIASSEPAITIAHLTDFHVEDEADLGRVRRALALVRDRKPDLVAITGDFFTDHLVLEPGYREVLRELADIAPTYAIGGNHDGGLWSRRRGGYESTRELEGLLSSAGIRFLENDLDTLILRGRRVAIYGAGDLWAGNCPATGRDLFGPDSSTLRILLAHNPDSRTRFLDSPWDILLAGHTHGGQLDLPFVGTPFAPVDDKRRVHGLFQEGDRFLEVSSGVGNLHGVRFNARPEVVFLRM